MSLGMEFKSDPKDPFTDEGQLKESTKNAMAISVSIGDACADFVNSNDHRDPVLVFSEVIAGLMGAAATIQSITKRDPQLIAAEFELGVRIAGMVHPVESLGEKFKDAILTLCDKTKTNTVNTPVPPGVN